MEARGVITTNIYIRSFSNILKEKNINTGWGIMIINYKIFSDECMLDFNNSLQQVNWIAVLTKDNAYK